MQNKFEGGSFIFFNHFHAMRRYFTYVKGLELFTVVPKLCGKSLSSHISIFKVTLVQKGVR